MKTIYDTNKIYYDELDKIVKIINFDEKRRKEFLNLDKKTKNKSSLSNNDGRLSSANTEKVVAKFLIDNYSFFLNSEKERTFEDIVSPQGFLIDIKSLDDNKPNPSNLCTFEKGLLYVFFGEKRNNNKMDFSERFLDFVTGDKFMDFELKNDFGFLLVSKNTGKVKWTSFLTMENYSINNSNGIQGDFNKITTNYKTNKQIKTDIITAYKKYILPHKIIADNLNDACNFALDILKE